MYLDYEKVTKVLEKLGYEPGRNGNEHIWRKVIDGIPYAVDFRTGDVFRVMYGTREYDAPGDKHFLKLKTTVEDVMSALNSESREAQAEPNTTGEEPEIPVNVPSEPQQDKPVETKPGKAPAQRTEAPARSNVHAVSIPGYTREQIETIKNTVAKGATDSELQMFMHVAQTYGLDPFLKEIYYSDKMHTIITSRDGYLKAAQRDPDFEGIQSMAVCENDEFELDVLSGVVKHSFGKGSRGQVIGAWAICYRKGRKPVISYASYDEYNQNNQIWSKYRSAMCCKVAEVFALKRQFGISGLVTQEEIGVEMV